MFWNAFYEGTRLAPRQYGTKPTLQSNLKHVTAAEEHPHLYDDPGKGLKPLYPDTKYYRRKLEIRAYAPSDLTKPLGDYYRNTVEGQVQKRADGKSLKSQRFNEDSKLNQTPGPKYDVNDKYTNSGFSAYSGYVAMARPKSASREYSKGLPGPGAYDTVKQPFHNVQSSNFTKMAGEEDIVNTKQKWLGETPAPHDYDVEQSKSVLRSVKLGKFSKSSRYKSKSIETPGPSKYRPYSFEQNEKKIGGLISKGDVPTSDDIFVRKSSKEPAPHDYGNIADKSRRKVTGGFLPKDNKVFFEIDKSSIPGPGAYGVVEPPRKHVQGGKFLSVEKFHGPKVSFVLPGPSDYNINEKHFVASRLGVPFGKLTEAAAGGKQNQPDSFHNPAPNQYVLPSVKSSKSAPMLGRLENQEDIRNRLQSDEPLYYDTRRSHAYLEPKPSYKMGNPSYEIESEISKFPGPDRYRLNPFATGAWGNGH